MYVSTKELQPAVIDCFYAGLVPYVKGSPGLGKSRIIGTVAQKLNLELIDVRLAQLDVTDLLGFPQIHGNKTIFVPPATFPINTDSIPKGKDGWLLFLDELSSANNSVSAAAYKLILDRMVGQYPLHQNVVIAAAGNKDTDKAIVNRMSTAMQSRLVHLDLQINPKDWVDWANENGIDYRITSFLEFKPGLVHNFNPDHKDHTYPAPRTWEFASKLIKDKPEINLLTTKILAGTVGEGAAREFKAFTEVFDSLPKMSKIIADPANVAFKTQPDILYAITGMVSNEATVANYSSLVRFVERLPLEFQIITWIAAIKRNKDLFSCKGMKEWVSNHAKDVLF